MNQYTIIINAESKIDAYPRIPLLGNEASIDYACVQNHHADKGYTHVFILRMKFSTDAVCLDYIKRAADHYCEKHKQQCIATVVYRVPCPLPIVCKCYGPKEWPFDAERFYNVVFVGKELV